MSDVMPGSKWFSTDMKEFVVISRFDKDDQKWVYYRTNEKENNVEYSCLLESFLSRFSPYKNG
jgi:hypothetical protein